MSMPNLQPPFPVPAGQTVLWLVPTKGTGGGAGQVTCFGTWTYDWASTANANGGSISLTGGCSLGTNSATITWNGYKVPWLPEGTTIAAIYPVVWISSGNLQSPGGGTLEILGNATNNVKDYLPGGALHGQYSVSSASESLGSSTADIANATTGLSFVNTVGSSGINDSANVSWAGIAVYATLGSDNAPRVVVHVGNSRSRVGMT